MIRLRFVEEYRGRRIVTNGKLFGIQGELITDCRYLSLDGARTAIASETGIRARREYFDAQHRSFVEYVEREGRDRMFECRCGWRGGYKKLTKDKDGRVIVRCPRCADGLCVDVSSSCSAEEAAASNTKNKRKPAARKTSPRPGRARPTST